MRAADAGHPAWSLSSSDYWSTQIQRRTIFCKSHIQHLLCSELHDGKGWLVVRRSLHKICKSSPLREKLVWFGFLSGEKLLLATGFLWQWGYIKAKFLFNFFSFHWKSELFRLIFQNFIWWKYSIMKTRLDLLCPFFVWMLHSIRHWEKEVFQRCC